MSSALAEETLHTILELTLQVPDDDFADVSGIHCSPFAGRQYSTADTLLVCKRWMRIATPLLYDTVVLRSVGQAQALAKALKKNPEFAPFLKKLRIEGGFGASVGKALHAATAISDLCLCLELNSKDNVAAMFGAVIQATISFPALRRLDLSVTETSKEQQDALDLDMPLLRELILPSEGARWLYDIIGRSQLPSIRFLSLPHTDPTAIVAVLNTHGPAAIDLATPSKHVQLALLLCPNLQTLRLSGGWITPRIQHLQVLDPAIVHDALAKLELPWLTSPRYYTPHDRCKAKPPWAE
ncbi:hypothetical protein AURDEDRAFT_188239 [Auricularia subglabra TFB-10046 SS5]|nr:hypothetical protein AURDEDRAFT_188239 [Auricularia subglabra TFB-10046 SS5]